MVAVMLRWMQTEVAGCPERRPWRSESMGKLISAKAGLAD